MKNVTILPADTYTVINKTILNDSDKKIISILYQPIIGHAAVSLYFTLIDDLDKLEIMSEDLTHHHLMATMQLKLEDIVIAREKLEAVGLLKTYIKEGNINNYVYLLYSPMTAHEFFNHPILNVVLYNNLGKMSYESQNLENGYPGKLTVSVVFTLTNDNKLQINYQAKTDKPTILNLTNHSYFNLKGEGNIFDTQVLMHANSYTPKDETNIPYGNIETVKGTPLDFTLEHSIGERIHMFEDGYDHNYVIDGNAGELRIAAEAYEPTSGRTLTFYTTEPGFQFYTAYYLNGRYSRGPLKFEQYAGFCFEAQHYPDSPNKPQFPTVVLRPGETYTQTTVYQFGIK